jgi:hypothetical protein
MAAAECERLHAALRSCEEREEQARQAHAIQLEEAAAAAVRLRAQVQELEAARAQLELQINVAAGGWYQYVLYTSVHAPGKRRT